MWRIPLYEEGIVRTKCLMLRYMIECWYNYMDVCLFNTKATTKSSGSRLIKSEIVCCLDVLSIIIILFCRHLLPLPEKQTCCKRNGRLCRKTNEGTAVGTVPAPVSTRTVRAFISMPGFFRTNELKIEETLFYRTKLQYIVTHR